MHSYLDVLIFLIADLIKKIKRNVSNELIVTMSSQLFLLFVICAFNASIIGCLPLQVINIQNVQNLTLIGYNNVSINRSNRKNNLLHIKNWSFLRSTLMDTTTLKVRILNSKLITMTNSRNNWRIKLNFHSKILTSTQAATLLPTNRVSFLKIILLFEKLILLFSFQMLENKKKYLL